MAKNVDENGEVCKKHFNQLMFLILLFELAAFNIERRKKERK